MKTALITGITGQDGAYLAEFLLNKGYKVHGIKRRSSQLNTGRIDHLYEHPQTNNPRLVLHYGDLIDSTSVVRLVQEIQPDEIYNLAAMSHVKVSFEMAEYTGNVNGLGALRILESIRLLGLTEKTRFYQASTSEMFGKATEIPQSEKTPLRPRSPYGTAKLYAHWTTVNYREAYGIFACNGILFNHESPRRGETFVTRKITQAAVRILLGMQETLFLGNLEAKRDWGHTRDYVEAMWLMLQQEAPDDYVIATGVTTSVREFTILAFEELGIGLRFDGTGINEAGVIDRIDTKILEKYAPERIHQIESLLNTVVVRIDEKYFRPNEVDTLMGDASKARAKLGWHPRTSLKDLIREMIIDDLSSARKV